MGGKKHRDTDRDRDGARKKRKTERGGAKLYVKDHDIGRPIHSRNYLVVRMAALNNDA